MLRVFAGTYRGWRRVLHRSDGRFVSWTWPIASTWRVVFSCGLLLVCASGAELSTGNCLLATAWATRRITIADLGRNLAISYIANAAGALAFAMLIADSGLLQSEYGRTAAAIAETKINSRLWTGVCARHSLQCPCVRRRLDDGISQDDHLKARWPHFSDQRIYYARV